MVRSRVTKTQFLYGTTIALRNSTQSVLVIEMQERVFESVGDVTFCLNEVPHAGRGAVNFTVAQDELSASNFDEPWAMVSGLEDAYGVISVSYTHLRAHETGRNLVCR